MGKKTAVDRRNDDRARFKLKKLVEKAQAGDEKAIQGLIDKYEALIWKIVRKYQYSEPSLSPEDLYQEGVIGVLNAIKTYKSDRGAIFTTWVYYQILGTISSAIRVDKKQPKWILPLESSDKDGNLEDPNSKYEPDSPIPVDLVKSVVIDCCGGLETRRAKIVIDMFGLFGNPELRNKDCAKKYGLTKYAINSHCHSFKKRVAKKYPSLKEIYLCQE